ncbi:MAG: hypothetical protein WD200_03340 [Candidatus Andersenbacteria bacterium]
MRSKTEAVEHIKQVHEAFGSMMHRFEEIFHAQWSDQECFMQMLLGAARPLRLLPNPSRLYRESKIPRDRIQAVIYGAGSVAQHLHHRRAITELLENQLSDLDDVPSINEGMRQLEDQERLYESWQRGTVMPEAPLDEYFAALPDDLKPLLGAIQKEDSESIYCLASWARLVELNADHILAGKSQKFAGVELVERLSRFLWDTTSLGRSVVIRRYDDPKTEKGRHIFDFLQVMVGAYGKEFAIKLMITATLLSDWAEGLADESHRISQQYLMMVSHLARAASDYKPLTPLRAFREGISTLMFSIAMLTAERIDRFGDPILLAAEAVKQHLPTQMAASFPPMVIGPLGITGGYIRDFVKDSDGTLELNRAVTGQLTEIQKELRLVGSSLPAAGYGCPLAYPINGGESQIDTLAKLFMNLLIQVDILYQEIQRAMAV